MLELTEREKNKKSPDHEFLQGLSLTMFEVMVLFKVLLLKLLLFIKPGTEAATPSTSPSSMEPTLFPKTPLESCLSMGEMERIGGDEALLIGDESLRRGQCSGI
jgi:hypothetical protein